MFTLVFVCCIEICYKHFSHFSIKSFRVNYYKVLGICYIEVRLYTSHLY